MQTTRPLAPWARHTLLAACVLLLSACGADGTPPDPDDEATGATTTVEEIEIDGTRIAETPVAGEEPLHESAFDSNAWNSAVGLGGGSGAGMGSRLRRERTFGARFANIEDFGPVRAADQAVSTFAAETDSGALAVVRSAIEAGRLPPRDAVRIEEFLNSFDYAYPVPAEGADTPFAVHTELAPCPWNDRAHLLRIGLKGAALPAADSPPRNLVFLIDTSGSMSDDLPLVTRAMKILTEQLRPRDRVALVTYAGRSGVALPPTSGADRVTIHRALDGLQGGGSTAGAAGIRTAYDLAREHFDPDGINRVLLCTDGDFNVGVSDLDALKRLIEEERESGVFLTVLGFGRGNLRDDVMESLARHGNGSYAYIDSAREARRVLGEQAGGTLVTIAKDVKIQVEFEPADVESWRLIGYANRRLEAEDFADDTKDAGELGAGHTVTALYEIVPTAAFAAPRAPAAPPWAQVRLRFKRPLADPGAEASEERTTDVHVRDPSRASQSTTWASAVATFGLVLRGSPYKGTATVESATALARSALGLDPFGHRAAFVDLMQKSAPLVAAAAARAARAEPAQAPDDVHGPVPADDTRHGTVR